jgi:hypothetical protein
MKLLVIEDEQELSKSICGNLTKDNFICEPPITLPRLFIE